MSLRRLQRRAMAVATDDRIARLVSRSPLAREIATAYVAGEDAEAAALTALDRVGKGLDVSLYPLDPAATNPEDAERATGNLLDSVAVVARQPELEGHTEVSVSLSGLGLMLPHGETLAAENARRVCLAARNAGVLVGIDDEGPAVHEAARPVIADLLQDFPDTGVTVQAARHDSLGQIRDLAVPGQRIRLCKGEYTGPRSVSLVRPHDIDLRMAACLRALVASPAVPLVASHDPVVISVAEYLADVTGRGDIEFQMLQGIRPLEQRRLVDVGRRMRVHLPWGHQWYHYCARRVVERPANIWLFSRSLVRQR